MKKAIIQSLTFTVLSTILAYLEIIPGMTKEVIFKYYFIDYFGIIFILIGQELLKDKNKSAFIFYIIGLVLNSLFGYMVKSYIMILFSLFSIIIFIRNWVQWDREEKLLEE